MAQPYEIDHEWIRQQQEHGDGTSVTVRLIATGPTAREGVLEWLQELDSDALGTRGRDQWLVREVKSDKDYAIVDITAGGDDVVSGLKDGTAEAYEILNALGAELEWEQLDQNDPKP